MPISKVMRFVGVALTAIIASALLCAASGGAAYKSPCSTVGHVTALSDPVHDYWYTEGTHGPPVPRGTDVVYVRVARNAKNLCADFTLRAPARVGSYEVLVRQAGGTDSGTLVVVQAGLGSIANGVGFSYPGADERPDHGRLKGVPVHVQGEHVWFTVNMTSLPAWAPRWNDFEWSALAVTDPLQGDGQYWDCAPNDRSHIAYPSGQNVPVDEPASC